MNFGLPYCVLEETPISLAVLVMLVSFGGQIKLERRPNWSPIGV